MRKLLLNIFFEPHRCWRCREWRLRFIVTFFDMYSHLCNSCMNKEVEKEKKIKNELIDD